VSLPSKGPPSSRATPAHNVHEPPLCSFPGFATDDAGRLASDFLQAIETADADGFDRAKNNQTIAFLINEVRCEPSL
jgi:hypothetical protein